MPSVRVTFCLADWSIRATSAVLISNKKAFAHLENCAEETLGSPPISPVASFNLADVIQYPSARLVEAVAIWINRGLSTREASSKMSSLVEQREYPPSTLHRTYTPT